MDIVHVRRAEALAAAAGLALLVLMFLPWFGGSVSGLGTPVRVPTATGWEAFGRVLDFLIALCAATPFAIAVARAAGSLPPLPVEQGVLVLGAGLFALAIVGVRLIDPPDVIDVTIPNVTIEDERKVAAFLALAAAAGIAYGGHLQRRAMRRVGFEPTLTGT